MKETNVIELDLGELIEANGGAENVDVETLLSEMRKREMPTDDSQLPQMLRELLKQKIQHPETRPVVTVHKTERRPMR